MTNPIDGSFNKNQIGQTTIKIDNNAGHPEGNKTPVHKESTTDKRANPSDQVLLTPFSQKLQQIEKSLADVPEVDNARVESIKQLIADGQYNIDSTEIASKLTEIEKLLG
jgi:negative regulator of flagellin synthesis FlgM